MAYWQLSQMGFDVYGIAWPGEGAAIKQALEEKGLTPRIKEADPCALEIPLLWPKPALCVNFSVWQRLERKEIVLMLSGEMRLAGKVLASAPSVFYRKEDYPNARLRRMGEYVDIAVGFEMPTSYYANKCFVMATVKSMGERVRQESERFGRYVDGSWFPETTP